MPEQAVTEAVTDRQAITRRLAPRFGKQHAALVASGSAALELSLEYLGVHSGHDVLVPSNTCHQVAASVIRSGATLHLVDPGESMVLDEWTIRSAVTPRTRAVIAVHQYGIPCPIGAIRAVVGSDIAIIEDAALAWDLRSRGAPLGAASNVVVTSFGEGKPLSIGEGGALFADDDALVRLGDPGGGGRLSAHPAIPYPLSRHAFPALDRAIGEADAKIAEAREFAGFALDQLHAQGLASHPLQEGDEPSWHYLPVRAPGPAAWRSARFAPEADALGICAPHPVPLDQIPMVLSRGIASSVPRRDPACSLWLLVDPIAANRQRSTFVRWLRHLHPS